MDPELANLVLLVCIAIGYMFPSMLGLTRRHHQLGVILVVNLFLGWTFIGWVVALAIAASTVRPRD